MKISIDILKEYLLHEHIKSKPVIVYIIIFWGKKVGPVLRY